MGNGRMFPDVEIGTIEHKKLRQLLDQHNGDAWTWGEGVDIGQNSTNKHVKHCLALLLRFLTLLLRSGAAKIRLQLIHHVRLCPDYFIGLLSPNWSAPQSQRAL